MRKQFLFPEMQPDIFFDFFLMSLCFSYIVAEERSITFIICGTKWAKRLKVVLLCVYAFMQDVLKLCFTAIFKWKSYLDT